MGMATFGWVPILRRLRTRVRTYRRRFHFRIRWRCRPFQDGPQSDFHSSNERNLKQISPDSVQYPLEGYKNVNFRYTTAAFTLSPESQALLCCADLRLICCFCASVHSFALGVAAPFGRSRLRLALALAYFGVELSFAKSANPAHL